MRLESKDAIYEASQYETDSDGCAIIKAMIGENCLCPFARSREERLSGEFANYLEVNAKQIPKIKTLHLQFEQNAGENLEVEERQKFEKAIKKEFAEKIVSTRIEIKSSVRFSVIMMLLGILMLLALYLNITYGEGVLREILTIVAWVFIWNATDTYFYKYTSKKSLLINYERLLLARIEFI